MSSRPTSSMKLRPELDYYTDVDLLKTPPEHTLCKQEPTRYSQRKSEGKTPQKRESTSSTKAVRPSPDIPLRDQRRAFNYIMMGSFRIDPTITRLRVFTWLLISSIKAASVLTATAFWLATVLFISSKFECDVPVEILCFALRHLGGPSVAPLWKHVCLSTIYPRGPHLILAVHASNYVHSPIVYSKSISILQDRPSIWLFVMAFMFINHCFACFAHDCAIKLKPDNT